MDKFIELTNALMLITLILILMAAFVSLPVMLLWDWLMPTLFGLGTITWVQSFGLLVLSGLLFKNGTLNKKD